MVSLPRQDRYMVLTYPIVEEGDHAIGIHGFTGVEFIILEIGDNLFSVGCSPLFEGLDPIGFRLLEFSLDGLHVTLEVSQIRLLVERGGLESEGVDDIINLRGSVLESLFLLLSRGIGTCPGSVTNTGMRVCESTAPMSTSAPALTVIKAQSTSKTVSSTVFLNSRW